MSTYYSDNFDAFIKDTKDCDMSFAYSLFEKYLTSDAKTILDIGFGSGRDSLYFSKKYDVYSIDPEVKFCEYGKSLGLKHVYNMKAQDICFNNQFDGIWACASLLHIKKNELSEVLKKCRKALKTSGVMYCSFKYGDFEGTRNGRYYTDLDENEIENIISDIFEIVEIAITEDVRANRESGRWLNVILKKV